MPTLADYQARVAALLSDTTHTLYATADLTPFITEARHVRDLDTRLVRAVLGVKLAANQITYSLAGVAAAPTTTLVRGEASMTPKDILSLHVLPQGGTPGGTGLRYPLSRQPYSRVAYLASTSWPGYPKFYARIGTDSLILVPPPSVAYTSEWDVVGVYPDLVNATDADPMPDPYNDPLPYLAAAIAKWASQDAEGATRLEQVYAQRMMRIREGIRQIAVTQPMADLPRGRL